MTKVRSSSIDAYYSLEKLQHFTNQHKQILEIFHANPNKDYTRKEIARITHLETSTVSARINELVHDLFELEELAEKRRCSISNINVYAVRLPKLPAAQRELFLEAA
jgi:Fic family protein